LFILACLGATPKLGQRLVEGHGFRLTPTAFTVLEYDRSGA
jgi:hypothetical protein